MNPEIKQKWITALRSGTYKQGLGLLRSKRNKYCCLGVLCSLAVDDHAIHSPILSQESQTHIYEGCHSILPDTVASWAGIGKELAAEHLGVLMVMNDNGESFEKIADYIQENM